MDPILTQAFEEIQTAIQTESNSRPERLFTLTSAKCLLFNYNLTPAHIHDGFTDGPNDGGIDFIGLSEDTDGTEKLHIIQTKFISSLANKQDVLDILNKIHDTITKFKQDEVSNYSENLRRIYRSAIAELDNGFDSEIIISVVFGCDVSNNMAARIEELIETWEHSTKYHINILYLKQLISYINSFSESPTYVSEASLKFNHSNGILHNSNNGILVNITSKNLRSLFDVHKDDGLFEQNFRYYIKNAKIDNQITNTISRESNQFWFRNNGIIIACEDYFIDGDTIKLYNFSIVNGCQTTTMIGKYRNTLPDFPLHCKIVKPSASDDFDTFVHNIAEASNSQKPISDKDLKSNDPIQKSLKEQLINSSPKVFMEIKRGERKPTTRSILKHHKTNNEFIGQLICSTILQNPGTARSNKKRIFSDNSFYNKVFRRNHNTVLYAELLDLYNLVDELSKQDYQDIELNSIAKNSKLCVTAIIYLMSAIINRQIDISTCSSSRPLETYNILTALPIPAKLFLSPKHDDMERIFRSIYIQIINILKATYLEEFHATRISSISNLFKTDTNYYCILQNIHSKLIIDSYSFGSFCDKFKLIFIHEV